MKQPQDKLTTDIEDILLWSDGTWCYRYELEQMKHMTYDYTVLYFGTHEYENLLATHNP